MAHGVDATACAHSADTIRYYSFCHRKYIILSVHICLQHTDCVAERRLVPPIADTCRVERLVSTVGRWTEWSAKLHVCPATKTLLKLRLYLRRPSTPVLQLMKKDKDGLIMS